MNAIHEATTDALRRVEIHANSDWKEIAAACVQTAAILNTEFTADDVIELLESEHPEVATHTNRALGPIFLRAEREGLIRNTDRVVKSRLPRRHGRKITVWQSLVFRAGENHATADLRSEPQ
jgi:hypothetical protein